MARLNPPVRVPNVAVAPPTSPVVISRAVAPNVAHEGGRAWTTDPETELFRLGVTFMFGEPTYYEAADRRAARYRDLITRADPKFVAPYLGWLRDVGGIRTAALVGAVEYARNHPRTDARSVVASVCRRADEPGEVLAYAKSRGKTPRAVYRGAADVVGRLWNEGSYLKWDSTRRAFRFADVLRLAHPAHPWQADLFAAIVAERFGKPIDDGSVPTVAAFRAAHRLNADQRRAVIDAGQLPAGMTWEAAISWAPPDRKTAVWQLVLPRMGAFAMIRNLNNLARAGLHQNDAVQDVVRAKLTNPVDVEGARLWPHHVLAAAVAAVGNEPTDTSGYRAVGGPWAATLDACASLTVRNIPELPGRTLVLVDTSGSMATPISARSKVPRALAGAMFGAAVAAKSPGATVWAYGTQWAQVPAGGMGVLSHAAAIADTNVGWGTNTWPAMADAWRQADGYDRVIVFTDMQDHPSHLSHAEFPCPIYVWDLAGYAPANIEPGSDRHLLGGWSDACFTLIELLETGRHPRELVAAHAPPALGPGGNDAVDVEGGEAA